MLFPCLVEDHGRRGGPSAAQRIFIVAMLGVCIALMYGMRTDLSVGVHEMQSSWPNGWTGTSLSAFFIGYMVGNIPGSLLAQRHGARTILPGGVLIASAANALIPYVSSTPELVVSARIVCGVAQACTFPCAYQLLHEWTTPATRSRAITSSMSIGVAAGTASGFFVSEQMRRAYGLAGCFGVWSAASSIWATAWLLLVPDRVPGSTSAAVALGFGRASGRKETAAPWHVLAFQPTLLVLYGCHCAANFINYGLLTQLPLFLTTSLHASAGTLAAGTTLPYLANVLLAFGAASIADALINSGRVSITHVRKAFTAVGLGLSGLLLFAAGCVTDATTAVVLVIGATGALGLAQPGWQALYLDAFGELSGTAYSYSNTLATLAGIAAPVIASTFVSRFGEAGGYSATFLVFGPLFGLPAVSAFCWVASATRVRLPSRGAFSGGCEESLSLSELMSSPDAEHTSDVEPNDASPLSPLK